MSRTVPTMETGDYGRLLSEVATAWGCYRPARRRHICLAVEEPTGRLFVASAWPKPPIDVSSAATLPVIVVGRRR